jgi:hypothetical protein
MNTALPKKEGEIHVPGSNVLGYNAIRTFYTPAINSTLINDQDIYGSSIDGAKNGDFEGLTMTEHRLGQTWTIVCHHKLRRSQDITMHGIMSNTSLARRGRQPKFYYST